MGVADVALHDSSCGKGIDRARGMSEKKAQVRLLLSWSLLSQGRQALERMEDGGRFILLRLVVAYFLLSKVSQLWAYADGKVHPEFLLHERMPNVFARSTG